jgi:hypothetical protein
MLLSILILFFLLWLALRFFRGSNAQNVTPCLPQQWQMPEDGRYPLVLLPRDYKKTALPERLTHQPQKGSSELYFFRYLKRHFPGCVFDNLALRIKDTYYYPDFVLHYEPCSLWIDIEIDEPYSLPHGEPTHYIGADERRNQFFLDKGWGVVRFTEEQVVRQPLACCRFLAELLHALTGDDSFLLELKNAPELTIRPYPWTEEDSRYMATYKTRQSYLRLVR